MVDWGIITSHEKNINNYIKVLERHGVSWDEADLLVKEIADRDIFSKKSSNITYKSYRFLIKNILNRVWTRINNENEYLYTRPEPSYEPKDYLIESFYLILSDTEKGIVQYKMAGYKDVEIRNKLEIPKKSFDYKMQIIQRKLSRFLEGEL